MTQDACNSPSRGRKPPAQTRANRHLIRPPSGAYDAPSSKPQREGRMSEDDCVLRGKSAVGRKHELEGLGFKFVIFPRVHVRVPGPSITT